MANNHCKEASSKYAAFAKALDVVDAIGMIPISLKYSSTCFGTSARTTLASS